MSAPKRIQLSRAKGWRKPEGAIVVARPTRWGNPWRIVPVHSASTGQPFGAVAVVVHAQTRAFVGRFPRRTDVRGTGADYWAVQHFRRDLLDGALGVTVDDVRRHLAGRDLCCWCPPDQECHADVLLELANQEEPTP